MQKFSQIPIPCKFVQWPLKIVLEYRTNVSADLNDILQKTQSHILVDAPMLIYVACKLNAIEDPAKSEVAFVLRNSAWRQGFVLDFRPPLPGLEMPWRFEAEGFENLRSGRL